MKRSEEDWKQRLSPECYYVCRGKGTEKPFQNKYWNHHETGSYCCVACGNALFHSKDKYDSGSGWPSFSRPIDKKKIIELEDLSLGVIRTEVVCSSCESHLGHVFPDGPPPTGTRYCINSASLTFKPDQT